MVSKSKGKVEEEGQNRGKRFASIVLPIDERVRLSFEVSTHGREPLSISARTVLHSSLSVHTESSSSHVFLQYLLHVFLFTIHDDAGLIDVGDDAPHMESYDSHHQ
jgi:hypothetical protein